MARSHDHTHPHAHHAQGFRRLAIALALALGYMVAEIIGGVMANSLALLADAGHMLTDAAALGLSLFAIWIARRPPSAEKTFGYYRAEVLAALVNGVSLGVIAVFVFIEAWKRFFHPSQVMGTTMMVIAIGGLIVNLVMMLILHASRSESLNVKGAWLHVLGDTAGSVGTIVAGVLIWTLNWNWTDPLAGALISLLILISSWRLLSETVGVLMEGAPRHIDVDQVRGRIASIAGVREVHDLHIWTITTGLVSLSAHITVSEPASHADLLSAIRRMLREDFDIHHTTLQLEPEDFEEHPTRI